MKQKAQLTNIQEQIILNAQAQFSLHEIGGLESTKEFQQQVNDLEVERKQHKARQKELKTVFLQKLDVLSSHRHDEQVYSSKITNLQRERSSPSRKVANVSADSGNGSKTVTPFDATGTVSLNIPQKLLSKSPGDENKREGFEGDIFGDVLQPFRGQSSGHCYTPVVRSMNPHNKTSPSFVPSQTRTNELSINEDTSLNRGESSKPSSNQAKDYFSKFSSSELETFLSTSSFPLAQSDKNAPDDNAHKEETESPSTLDSLLLQQKRLLELQEVGTISFHTY